MKKLFLSGLALFLACAGPTQVKAMLGETKAQSASRYGKPFHQSGDVLYYKQKGFVISQWFNASGITELIGYFKLSGIITEQESAKICDANLPPIASDSWIEQKCEDDNCRLWESLDSKWGYESGWARLGNSTHLYSILIVGSVAGFAGLNAQFEGHQENNNFQDAANAKSDI